MYARYRNQGARHTYEKDTKNQMSNLKSVDNFIKARKGLSNSTMNGANNKVVRGSNTKIKKADEKTTNGDQSLANKAVNSAIENNPLASLIKDSINKKK